MKFPNPNMHVHSQVLFKLMPSTMCKKSLKVIQWLCYTHIVIFKITVQLTLKHWDYSYLICCFNKWISLAHIFILWNFFSSLYWNIIIPPTIMCSCLIKNVYAKIKWIYVYKNCSRLGFSNFLVQGLQMIICIMLLGGSSMA